ncbi:MAG: fimbrillin family protein [Bacteroidales bacterium]
MARLKTYIALLLTITFFMGCSKNTNLIYIGNPNDSISGNNSGIKKSYLTFSGYIESINSNTKTLSIMPINELATIFVFNNGQDPNHSVPSETCTCLSHKHGLLEPLSNKDSVYLSKGEYEFYSISNLSGETPPTFTHGVSEPLKNGIDYAWAKHPDFEVTNTYTNVPLTYTHSATQIAIKLNVEKGITLDSIISTSFHPTKEGARMHLIDGYIEPAQEFSDKVSDFILSKNLALATVLPVKTNQPLSVTYTLLINNDLTKREFNINIALPNGELKAGNSYLFEVTLNADLISFSNVNIIEWIDVDKTGQPLYPSQFE